MSKDTMLPRERILAALDRKPVDRIPYCEHLVDPRVALESLDEAQRAEVIGHVAKRLGIEKPVRDLSEVRAALAALASPGEGRYAMFRLMGALEPEISRAVHRDNITFWDGGVS